MNLRRPNANEVTTHSTALAQCSPYVWDLHTGCLDGCKGGCETWLASFKAEKFFILRDSER